MVTLDVIVGVIDADMDGVRVEVMDGDDDAEPEDDTEEVIVEVLEGVIVCEFVGDVVPERLGLVVVDGDVVPVELSDAEVVNEIVALGVIVREALDVAVDVREVEIVREVVGV